MGLGLFHDRIVPSTELNRRPGQGLRQAAANPATITRPHGDPVLMRRTLAASVAAARDVLPSVTRELIRRLGRFEASEESLKWLDALEPAEWESTAGGEAVLHGWAESRRWQNDPDAMAVVLREESGAATTGGVPFCGEAPQR